ncbi:MAG: hypothetical protein KTR28_00355 [Micavibrio sp.]|nr:hypothetical protein [Micavibrio sp.]
MTIEKEVRNAADCKCYGAVMRTFAGLSDEPRTVAEEAAIRVYRYHHPEDTVQAATLTVQRWLAGADSHAVN